MEDNKKAAKAFVDMYFPKQPNAKKHDALSDLFPPKSQMESFRELGYEGQSSHTQSAAAEGYYNGKATGHGNTAQKSGNAVVFYEVSEPSSLGSSVDYGCRENYYPNASANRQPGSSYDKKDQKNDYPDPKHSRGEWWQGSLYY